MNTSYMFIHEKLAKMSSGPEEHPILSSSDSLDLVRDKCTKKKRGMAVATPLRD